MDTANTKECITAGQSEPFTRGKSLWIMLPFYRDVRGHRAQPRTKHQSRRETASRVSADRLNNERSAEQRWLSVLRCGRMCKTRVVVAFSSRARTLGECSTIHSPLVIFFFSFCFCRVDISLRRLIALFTPGLVYSGSASSDDCNLVIPDELRLSSFSERFPHYAWTAA